MKVVALVSYKYDRDYLDDLKYNIRDLVDDVIVRFDKHGDFWRDEGKYRLEMIKDAEKKGADYALVIDPDERIEKKSVKKLRQLMKSNIHNKVQFEFNFRELYEPNKYRCDGVWGKKSRIMLFSIKSDNIYSDAKLHTPRNPINSDFITIKTGFNVYHLKHIKPEMRRNRKEIYNYLDSQSKYNKYGYNYLDDDTNMRLKKISFFRKYTPEYREYKIDKHILDFVNNEKNKNA